MPRPLPLMASRRVWLNGPRRERPRLSFGLRHMAADLGALSNKQAK